MTRKVTRNYSVVAPIIAILTLLVAAAVLAQTSGAGRPTEKANAALTQAVTSASAQAERPLNPREDGTARFAVGHPRTKRKDAVPMGSKPPLFLPAVTYDLEGSAVSVAVADVNGDGKPDLVVATWSTVAVMLGNGDGTFQPAVEVGGSNGSVAVADVNGDGKPDLVVTGCTDTNCVGYVGALLGNGDGTFQPAVTYDSGGSNPLAVAVAAVNGDGKPDLIVVNCMSNGNSCGYDPGVVGILLGNGDGTFQTVVTYDSGAAYPDSVVVADVNGDSKRDLVVAEGGGAAVLLGNGNGTFEAPVMYSSGGLYPSSVAVADVNGDHKPDLVVANQCSEPTCNADGLVSVLPGNGDGTFQPAVTYDSGGFEPRSVAVANVNRDGKPDLAVANTGADGGSVGILLGNGDGTFQPAVTYDSGGIDATGLALGDVNGDHLQDLVVANQCSTLYCLPGSVGVLLNNTGLHRPTVTTLVSSLNPSVFGQAVLFTATVSSLFGTPTGIVVFSDGSARLGSGTLMNGGTSISMSALVAGSRSITAAYQESLKYSASVSAPLDQIVTQETTTTSVVSSFNPARVSQTVTYTATVYSQYGGNATGTVTFQDGGVTIATVTLVGNQAACTTNYAVPGTHAITAVYSGDANNTGSASSTLVEQINKAFASKTVLTTSGSPSFVGQPVTFTATVTSTHGAIPDGELVTFYDGTTTLGSAALASGVAAYTTSSLSAKTHSIKATYTGDATFEPSSAWVKQVVDKYPTTTTLTSSPNPSVYRQTVTFTATVTPTGPYPLTGKVWFRDGTLGIGSATLSGGVATLTKKWLTVGTHAITAEYLGDAANARSTSSVLDQVVQ